MSEGDDEENLEGKGVGWPDGVGDGRPFEVPMTLDYFQGFLAQAGVPITALPKDGRTLGPQQAMELLPHLLSTPLTLGNFGLQRMAAHLLLEVAAGGEVVARDELHARMRRLLAAAGAASGRGPGEGHITTRTASRPWTLFTLSPCSEGHDA
ncbi:MAG TPA: hypothetical protein VE057_05750 [Archangium sp.]|nr:hypothetical protein [Archangium sp.]